MTPSGRNTISTMASRPTSSARDWRAASRLVKALFVQEQYRQCIQVCRDILKAANLTHNNDTPLQKAFVNFYLALCYDEVARIMHHNSVAKMPAFDSAEHHYMEALTSLPSIEHTRELCTRRQKHSHQDPFTDVPGGTLPSSPSVGSDYFDRPHSRASSLNLSSPPRGAAEEDVSEWEAHGSPVPTISDLEDLESHHSYSELVTPFRLQRDRGQHEQSRTSTESSPRFLQIEQKASRGSVAERTPTKSRPRDLSRTSSVQPPQFRTQLPQAASRLSMASPSFKALPREVSRMSLIDHSPSVKGLALNPTTMSTLASTPRPHSMYVVTQGLMRSSTTGTPPRTFHIPPGLQQESNRVKARASLPRLITHMQNVPPLQPPRFSRALYTTDVPVDEPVSPMSPASSISPAASSVSPVSPIAADGFEVRYSTSTPVSTPHSPTQNKQFHPAAPEMSQDEIDQAMLLRMGDHLASVRTQLERHVDSVRRAKEQLRHTQLEKKKNRQTVVTPQRRPDTVGSMANSSSPRPKSSSYPKQLQKVRSFWSFVPEDDKAAQKKQRIAEGRARKWERKRFDPTRYQNLCEAALDELAAA